MNIDIQTTKFEALLAENAQLKKQYQQFKIKERYLKVINDFATSILPHNTVEDIVWEVAKNAIAHLDYEDCVVYLIDEKREYLIQMAAYGPKNPIELDILNPMKIKIGEGIVGTVAKTGIPEIIADTRKDPRYIVDDQVRLSEISVPIVTDTNNVIGVIDSENSKTNFYSQADVTILKTIASITATKILKAKAREEMERSNKALEQFAYIASHDLREPLRMIASYAQLLEKNYQSVLDERGEMFLNFLMDGAKRMNLLINDLLTYSRLKKKDEELQLIDLEEVMEEVLTNLEFIIEENEGVIEKEPLPKIRGYYSQTVQLFQNLINNAIKFKSEQDPHIQIKVKDRMSEYLISIKDNGIGIAPEYHEQIFQVFQRLHNRNEYEGSGIGLAICKKIVENFGGKIWVESEQGSGSTFWVTLLK